ncbi:ribonuclease domain-containing protein [Paenibacillus polymyxa]|uniref:ribonuclease domain-containing protein n=1 Tax=Paenibacillus polymyxa TaxID=1406 RepID=UPI003F490FFD
MNELSLKKWLYGALVVLVVMLLFVGCSKQSLPNLSSNSNQNEFSEVAKFISEHHELPSYFITKKEARDLGWEPSEGNLHKVAPGKSIGGDVFRNREGLLPKKQGRIWYEADINYSGGTRGSDRILYSNDGLVYKTTDHYRTFEQLN